MRINARLDDTHSQKLEYLKRATNAGVSEVVKEAIDVYYERVKSTRPRAAEIFTESGFVGIAEGPEDLSTRYKEVLTEDLETKHGDR